MKKREIPKAIDELIELSFKDPKILSEREGTTRFFGIGESNISFNGIEDITLLQKTLNSIYRYNSEIYETVSFKTFETIFIQLMRQLRQEKRKCSEGDIEKQIKTLLNIENVEREVLYELYGCEMQQDTLELGEFTIYNLKDSEEHLLKKYPHLSARNYILESRNSDILLGVKVTAREDKRATELADKFVASFENALNYMTADLTHQRQIGIFNNRKGNKIRRIISSDSSIGFSGTNEARFPIKIDDAFFIDPSQGNDKVWDLLTKKGKTEIEKRLVQAIEWIGRGVVDPDKSKALVQFVFSIEGMLKFNDKTPITPSIVSQLSDWLAFIVQDDPEERREIAKNFKITYGKRSAVVHGGNKSIDIEDLKIALKIAKLMTLTFLRKEPFKQFKNMHDLNEYMTRLKFQ